MAFRRHLFPFIILLLVLSVFVIGPVSAENLLTNGDFVHIGNDGLPEGWYTDAYISDPGYSVFALSEGDPEHPVAVSIQNIGENDARIFQIVEVEPDSLYCFSGYIMAENVEGGHGANLSIEGLYAFSDKCFDTEGEWEYIEYYGETGPEQHALTVFARLGGYSGVSTGKACFADLSLKKVDSVPGDGIADLWYKDDSFDYADEDEDEPVTQRSYRKFMLLIAGIYTVAALFLIYHENKRKSFPEIHQTAVSPIIVIAALLLSLLLRMFIAWFTEGYMVDVNCFLSWGRTMASAGPAGFYEATNFCDYPPLYTYVLAFNSIVSGLIPNSEPFSRIVFRLIPCLCDLLGCLILYGMLLRRKEIKQTSCFLFFVFSLFNPATILNSSAWGQMDSVLCMLILIVALLAIDGKWKAALPVYVVAVLVKPQALMLGPLGLAYILITAITKPESRKPMVIGTLLSLLTLAAGVIPFSIHQNWDWLVQLYIRTLGSYPYSTVNTANLYYVLGGNWSAVNENAHILAPAIMCVLSAGYGIWWYIRAGKKKFKLIETLISCAFATAFAVLTVLHASWAWVGALSMAFAFVIVLSPAVRTRDLRLLPWLGGLLYILLYVFGVKMHERYIFPALLLLGSAWVLKRDRRILYILLLFTFTLFANEYIVLDNSIRLGSYLGHLNNDTVWFADIISLLNVFGSVYAVWLGLEMTLPERKQKQKDAVCALSDWKPDHKLHWQKKDTIILVLITAIYSAVCLLTLGSNKAPQNGWSSSSADEQIVFDLGEYHEDVEILYFAQVSRYDFTFSSSNDGENWDDETWAQMDQGQCWKWKYVTEYTENANGTKSYHNVDDSYIVRFSGRYIRLTAQQLGLKLNEILFRDPDGTILPAEVIAQNNAEPESELYSDPNALTDEQDTMEGLPSFPGSAVDEDEKIQPSWWNSTYFDEIYHARTGYEFLNGTVPYETTHPPLGKVLISFWISIFGMTPFGWRFAGALAGILMLPGMYLTGKQLTKKTWIAALSCALMALDCMHLTQTQIATIDSFPVLFIIFAYFFMLRFIQTDIIKEKLSVSLFSLAFSGLFMGLSIASKWIGIYAGAGLAVLFFWHCIRMIRMHNHSDKVSDNRTDQNEQENGCCADGQKSNTVNTFGRIAVICAWCVLFFVIVPIVIYLLSYIPYMAYNFRRIQSLWDYLEEVWRSQINMLNYHSTPGLGMDHPFYSPWWQWPIMGKPMFYASKQYLPADYPVHHSIFAFGNPVIWFPGLAALLVCIYREVIRRRYRMQENDYLWHIRSSATDSRYIFMLIGLLAQYLPWVLVPRGTYIYHYFASLPFLMTAISLCFDTRNSKYNRISMILSCVYIGIAAVFFILLFPYASGLNVSDTWLNIGQNFARIWY